ncbi:MAG: tRNA (N6-threonylcarbamoyladenosine(37)-N6)-methyltransferase TrmO [Desulfovibrionaceae bacterium]
MDMTITPVGIIRSPLKHRDDAPKQGNEGAPSAELHLDPAFASALEGLAPGARIILLTWLHKSDRSCLRVHPRGDVSRPIRGVFSTRSPDRPNPIGLHEVTITAINGTLLVVTPLEAIDGTPVLDIKST